MELTKFMLSQSATPKASSTIAVHDTIYSSWSNLSKTSPTICTSFDNTDKTWRLPNELRTAFLQLSLPEVDILASSSTAGVCRSYVARLYALRQVSASWRDLVDRTPSLWAIVSSTTPIEIISVCLSRSKAHPLLIHYTCPEGRALYRGQTSFLRFFELTKPHRHRWAMARFYVSPDLAAGLFNTVMPLLHTVKLVSAARTPSPSDTPFGAEVKALQNVAVRGGPANWALGHFRGLRTWRLEGLRGDGLTTEHILGILRENPLLEMLDIHYLRVKIIPDNILLTPIPLLRLTSLTMSSCYGDFVDHILRRIRIPIDRVNQFCIAVKPNRRSPKPIRLWTDVLASWSPAFQRAHQTCGGSKFRLSKPGTFSWRAKGGGIAFRLGFSGVKAVTGVQWIAGILSQVDESRAGASIECESTALEDVEDLKLLGSTDMITTFDVSVGRTGTSLLALFQAFGDPATPAFPCLETLKIKGFSWSMESIVKMLQVRFTDNRSGITQLPRLTIEVSYPEWSSDSPFQRQIIDFDTVKAISALNGVERFHFGCVIGKDGMLGVVWSDELGGPTWG